MCEKPKCKTLLIKLCLWFFSNSLEKLKALQCHFTWALDISSTKFPELRQRLEDINPQEGHPWLGCVHNLLGFINFHQNSNEDALNSFKMAAEAFRGGAEEEEEGSCLVGTYGNLAWLYHHLGKEEESQMYLSKVKVLMETHVPPSQDELHPEVCAEKAWTLMTFSVPDHRVGEYFQKAIEGRPDMVAWNTSYVLWLIQSFSGELEEELMEKLRNAKERDPKNTNLAVLYLNQRAMRGEDIEEEARRLADKIMESPVGSYSGMKALLWIFTRYISANEAMNLAEQLLEHYPEQHYAKTCAASTYRWSLSSRSFIFQNESLWNVRDRAIALHQDLILRYPGESVTMKLRLAGIYTKFDLDKAEQEYIDLLGNPNVRQEVCHKYANFLNYQKKDSWSSARQHMEVLKIPKQSLYYKKSYEILDTIRKKNLFRDLRVDQFLSKVPPPKPGWTSA